MEWETFKGLWPVAAVGIAQVVTVKIGQALNRKDIAHMRMDMNQVKEQAKEDKKGLHARIDRHEQSTETTLTEIRNDIKELLRRAP